MNTAKAKLLAQKILDLADVKINGTRPWDIKVHDERFYNRALTEGSLGLGEAYVDGWWEAEKLDEFFDHILRSRLDEKILGDWKTMLWAIGEVIVNKQRKSKAFEVAEKHYDIGNDLYEKMLDKKKVYTCGYWKNASNLDEAQEAKLDLVCRKLNLKAGQRILDIGCGWGSFAKFAAEKYGVSVVGVTVSKEQISWGDELCKGLPVELHFKDYRDIEGKFDHIVSLGMFEHVGHKNYKTYMKIVSDHLKDDGLFLLHTIGINYSAKTADPWIEKYIFPNGRVPSAKQITSAIEKLFVMEDWHSFGADYDKTLLSWFKNFDENWEKLKPKYGDRFYRMWKYYLLVSAASFRSRRNQLWQIVLSKDGLVGGYESIR
ncbi:cyclopropane fatty acyl phospholipid synthase [Patescibacteria group bacterium]|nr:MAG: cyclopropane fatty acyl phospholipid synthase [Patescibacteria group bacterium]